MSLLLPYPLRLPDVEEEVKRDKEGGVVINLKRSTSMGSRSERLILLRPSGRLRRLLASHENEELLAVAKDLQKEKETRSESSIRLQKTGKTAV